MNSPMGIVGTVSAANVLAELESIKRHIGEVQVAIEEDVAQVNKTQAETAKMLSALQEQQRKVVARLATSTWLPVGNSGRLNHKTVIGYDSFWRDDNRLVIVKKRRFRKSLEVAVIYPEREFRLHRNEQEEIIGS